MGKKLEQAVPDLMGLADQDESVSGFVQVEWSLVGIL